MTVDRSTTRSFVLRYFRLLGGNVEETAPDVFRIELDRDQAAELEGTAPPFWLANGNTGEKRTFYFTFTPEVAERNDEVELVSPGSHRLQQVIRSVRRLGRVNRVWLPVASPAGPVDSLTDTLRYRPFFLFCFRLDFRGVESQSRLVRIAVDRVEQFPLRQLAEIMPRLPLEDGFPQDARVEEAEIGFDAAFAVAFDDILAFLEESPHEWAETAARAVEEERERLVSFYEERARDGDDIRQERSRRLEELDQMRPRVMVRTQGVTEAHLPVFYEDGYIRHLAFDHASGDAPGPQSLGFPQPALR